jgi:cell wall-associated NlpC family hydrolase
MIKPENQSVTPTRAAVLQAALKYEGVRWKLLSRDPKLGLDCVGFLANVAWDLGYQLEDTQDYTPKAPSVEKYRDYVIGQTAPGAINCIRTGTILLLRSGHFPWHTGIAIMEKDGLPRMIHASIRDRKVVIDLLSQHYSNIVNVREFPGVI